MLTGPDFHEQHTLDDGTVVTIRHIRPADASELRRGFDALSAASRHARFHGGSSTLSDEALRYLTEVDGHDHVALVATTQPRSGEPEVGLGVARFVRSEDDPTVAEAAMTVLDAAQHKGLGRILGIALGRAAIERGIERLRGEVLGGNAPVRALLDEFGAEVRHAPDGNLEFEVTLVSRAKAAKLLGWLRLRHHSGEPPSPRAGRGGRRRR